MWFGVVGNDSVHLLTFWLDFDGFLLFGWILIVCCPVGVILVDCGVDLGLLVVLWPLVGPKKNPKLSFD